MPATRGASLRNPNAPDRVAFTATVRPGRRHDPGLAQPQYITHPYRVSLSFLGRQWAALDVEVSDSEIGPHAYSHQEVDLEIIEIGNIFGFGEIQPIRLIDLELQIAQKIHAATDPSYARAHDLVDL